MLLYTSPSNPLGWVASEEDQERLLEFTRRHDLWLMADEVYERLYYPALGSKEQVRRFEATGPKMMAPAPSILTKCTRDDAVVAIQSLSKSYCMTGWRIGWLVGRKDLVERASQLNEFIISCASGFVAASQRNRAAVGRGYSSPDGMPAPRESRFLPERAAQSATASPCLFPTVRSICSLRIDGVTDSFAFCKQLLMETKVGLAPGVAFGAGARATCGSATPPTCSPIPRSRLPRIARL